jgi:hypothetical protein
MFRNTIHLKADGVRVHSLTADSLIFFEPRAQLKIHGQIDTPPQPVCRMWRPSMREQLIQNKLRVSDSFVMGNLFSRHISEAFPGWEEPLFRRIARCGSSALASDAVFKADAVIDDNISNSRLRRRYSCVQC